MPKSSVCNDIEILGECVARGIDPRVREAIRNNIGGIDPIFWANSPGQQASSESRRGKRQKRHLAALANESHDNGSRTLAFEREHLKLFEAALPERGALRVLDVGCGLGKWATVLGEGRRIEYTGIDQCEAVACKAGEFGVVSIRRQDAKEFLFNDRFDLVLFGYEFLNQFEVGVAACLVRRAYNALSSSGAIVGDYRPRGSAGLQRARVCNKAGNSVAILVVEGRFRNNELYGRKKLSVDLQSGVLLSAEKDLLRTWDEFDFSSVTQLPQSRCRLYSLADIATTKKVCSRNIGFIIKRA